MIAGLLFANHEIDGPAGQLAATQPFAGATLIEHQARQLAGLGATQIVVIAAQLTPVLVGAIGRMARRLTVDRVDSVAAAAATFHPLASVTVLADGTVAGEALLAPLRGEGGDVLVAATDDGSGRYERLGGGLVWAGAARVAAERLAEAAALPRDYDPQSTLVRVAAQAGAATVTVPIAASVTARPGEPGMVHADALVLDRLRRRSGWFSRYVVQPVARLLTAWLAAYPLPAAGIVGVIGATGVLGIAAIASGWPRIGLLLALASAILAPIGSALLGFRGDDRSRALTDTAAWLVPALAALALGETVSVIVTALALIGIAALGERARVGDHWWNGDPGGYLLLITLAALAGVPAIGLAIAALYAFVTLAVRIEAIRQRA